VGPSRRSQLKVKGRCLHGPFFFWPSPINLLCFAIHVLDEIEKNNMIINSLLSSIENLLEIFDAFPFYFMLIDEDHRILLANGVVKEQLGVEGDNILGGYCPKVIHGLDHPYPGCPLEEAVKSGKIEERRFFDEKTNRWVESSIYPTRNRTQDGKQIFIHLIRDISAEKQAVEEKDRLSEELQQALTQVLSGFIPICASCYKIRDSANQWQPVEKYITSRTNAEFSHGLCEECARKLYGHVPAK
jgi:PAS domain S-box-containing protein